MSAQRLLAVLAMFAVGCGGDCQSYCTDLAGTYQSLAAQLSDPSDLPGYSSGSWDEAEYLAACESAPETNSCEECSSHYWDDFLEPAGIQGSCEEHYGRGDAEVYALDAATAEDQCLGSCRTYGLK